MDPRGTTPESANTSAESGQTGWGSDWAREATRWSPDWSALRLTVNAGFGERAGHRQHLLRVRESSPGCPILDQLIHGLSDREADLGGVSRCGSGGAGVALLCDGDDLAKPLESTRVAQPLVVFVWTERHLERWKGHIALAAVPRRGWLRTRPTVRGGLDHGQLASDVHRASGGLRCSSTLRSLSASSTCSRARREYSRMAFDEEIRADTDASSSSAIARSVSVATKLASTRRPTIERTKPSRSAATRSRKAGSSSRL